MADFLFTSPLVLWALLLLPALWWLLRLLPPQAKRVSFPALALLQDLAGKEETPARTPWWMLFLRLLIAALILFALAGPVYRPAPSLPGQGPVILVVDNGYAAARDWPARQKILLETLARAERDGRSVVLFTTAQASPDAEPLRAVPRPAADVRSLVQTLVPQPWSTDRRPVISALETARADAGSGLRDSPVFWLSDGIDGPGADALSQELSRFGELTVYSDPLSRPALLLRAPERQKDGLQLTLLRAPVEDQERMVPVSLHAEDGEVLAEAEARFAAGDNAARLKLSVPSDVLNRAVRVVASTEAGRETAGSVFLLDSAWQRREVGLVAPSGEAEQPFLSGSFFIERALSPFAVVERDTPTALLRRGVSLLILDDVAGLSEEEQNALSEFVKEGGVLVRFAGPKMAAAPDDLVPVSVRGGTRRLGGSVTWQSPLGFGRVGAQSPLADLAPDADIKVERQLLSDAVPDENLWVSLEDGTPLITGARRGHGYLVLFHVSSGPEWSNLPLSGFFVQVLKGLLPLTTGETPASEEGDLPPYRLLDGFAELKAPMATALPVSRAGFLETRPSPQHPPGYYGHENWRVAFNLGQNFPAPAAVTYPAGVRAVPYSEIAEEMPFAPWLWLFALLLFLADYVLSLRLRGLWPSFPWLSLKTEIGPRHGDSNAGKFLLLAMFSWGAAVFAPASAAAQQIIEAGPAAAHATTLAYVLTGDPALDPVSEAGLRGLARVLMQRTAMDEVQVAGVRPGVDALAFYPLLYWPIGLAPQALSAAAVTALNQYLRQGGMILFDMAEADAAGADGMAALRAVASGLDIPPLRPMPEDHLLTRSFYLLREFPGRYAAQTVWVEAEANARLDGVSSVVLGASGYAAAWATDASGRFLYLPIPGGEAQREQALRFGVNLVMYVLTGTYKSDQVHVPAILERLKQ